MGIIEGFKVGKDGVNVSHLQFVGDIIPFSADVEKLKKCVIIPGMKINMSRCCFH